VKRRFRLTPEARTDLPEILLDVATDRPDAAERLRSRNYEALQTLGKSSGIGHFHEELLDRRYRFWNFYPYMVCYAWQEKPIQIVAVVHGAGHLAAFLTTRTASE
jgi:plasmid stabilization system protein ParE